jgi:cytochrome c oxidase cbb3-type subunit 1
MAVYWIGLTWGGILQGLAMDNPDVAFLDVVRHTMPYLWSRTFAGVLMAVGHVAFAILVWRMFTLKGRRLPEPASAPVVAMAGGAQ